MARFVLPLVNRHREREKTMGTIEANVEKNLVTMEKQLKAWAAKLDELVEKAEKSGEHAKAESHQRFEALREKLTATQKKLEEVKRAESGKWDKFKADLNVAWLDVEAAFKALTRPPKEAVQDKTH